LQVLILEPHWETCNGNNNNDDDDDGRLQDIREAVGRDDVAGGPVLHQARDWILIYVCHTLFGPLEKVSMKAMHESRRALQSRRHGFLVRAAPRYE
jgi:hypothetical protein